MNQATPSECSVKLFGLKRTFDGMMFSVPWAVNGTDLFFAKSFDGSWVQVLSLVRLRSKASVVVDLVTLFSTLSVVQVAS